MSTQPSFSVTVEQLIHTPPAQVYFAFTNATAIREWLCEVATLLPKPGGRMYLWWNGDFYSSGEYTSLEPGKTVSFTWRGRSEAVATPVSVTLVEQADATLVKLTHTVYDENYVQGYQNEWKVSLENLASVLETGKDLRIFNRPMLGIGLNDFNAVIAGQLGVPVHEGIRLDSVAEGMGAKAAGLQQNDVLVSLNGKPLTDFGSLPLAIQGNKGGDRVEVVFYRGPEQKTVSMELSRRPVPEIPFDPAVLAQKVRAGLDASLSDLAEALKGISETAAAHKPSPDEWSVKETLAHLIHGDRFTALYLAEVVTGFERWADDWGGNWDKQVQATAAAFPSTPAMLDELHKLADEMVLLLESLPPEFVARKGSYFRIAWNMLQGPTHTTSHIQQILAAAASSA